MDWTSEDIMPKREGEKALQASGQLSKGTGRGTSREIERLPGGGELLGKYPRNSHTSFYDILFFLSSLLYIFFHIFHKYFLKPYNCM